MTTNTNIANALLENVTCKNEIVITKEQATPEEYGRWIVLLQSTHEVFVNYQRQLTKGAVGKEVDKAVKNQAYDKLKSICNMVGEVNGFKLTINDEVLELLSRHALKEVTRSAGDLLLWESELAILKEQEKNFCEGMNPAYIEDVMAKMVVAKETIKDLRKEAGSGKAEWHKNTYSAWRKKFERTLAKMVRQQFLADEEDLKKADDERKAARKARKNAEKAKAAEATRKAKEEAGIAEEAEAENK